MNNMMDIIVSIAVAAISINGGYLVKFLTSNKKLMSLMSWMDVIAHDAVIIIQKLGVNTYLEGQLKKSKAFDWAKQALKILGFNNVDETLLKSAIEKQYAALITDLNQVYPQKTLEQSQAEQAAVQAKAQADQREADKKAKADALAAAKQAVIDAQAKVVSLTK